jgi:pSer/pThr/pTyr-binding forkhead associated (FHA) protein
LIGRDEHCDLTLADPKVSHEHAAILPGPGPFRTVRDLGSANGTLVNGRPLRSPAGFSTDDIKQTEISGGEWLQVGDTIVRVTLVDPRESPTLHGSEPPHQADNS